MESFPKNPWNIQRNSRGNTVFCLFPTNETTCIWTPLTKVWTFGWVLHSHGRKIAPHEPPMITSLKWNVAIQYDAMMFEAGDTCSKPSCLVSMLVFGGVKIEMLHWWWGRRQSCSLGYYRHGASLVAEVSRAYGCKVVRHIISAYSLMKTLYTGWYFDQLLPMIWYASISSSLHEWIPPIFIEMGPSQTREILSQALS